jgi:hypothetical protein
MFIKFSDKTKKITVKTSKEDAAETHNDEENTVYLDEELDDQESDDRRIKVLKKYNSNKLIKNND